MEFETGLGLASIAAIVLTILLYIKVLPKKLDGTFEKKGLQKLHDYFHFKKLYLESVMKFIFVLATVTVVCVGVFMLFSYTGYGRWKESMFWYGVIMLVAGPISVRLAYEGIMMFILLVKNVMDINNKLSAPKTEEPEAPAAQEEEAV